MPKRCPAFYAFNSDGQLIAVRCGSWYCPTCMKINARMWSWRVTIHMTLRGGPAYFWTFTLGKKYKTATQGFAALPKLWDRLRKYLSRNMSGRWEYVAFVEGQPLRGHMPHFHIISLQKCPKRIKDVAVWNGFGYEAKEKRITSAKAASYVSKYASKQSPVTPRGFRRVRASQGWSKLPEKSKATIYVQAAKESLQEYLTRVASETAIPLDCIVDTWLHKETAFDYWEREAQ
ncbi:MAG TPA: hypothetical protein VIY48_12135 [Candidatus Paceibacterota bacterium]